MINLGVLYATGEGGFPTKYDEAAKLYSAGLDKNFPEAACYLAELYAKGLGVPQDREKARQLCEAGYNAGAQLCKQIWDSQGLAN